MKEIIVTFFLSLSFFVITACGKNSDSSDVSNTVTLTQEEQSSGSYRAILRPLNNSLSGFLPSGMAVIKIENNQFMVKTYLDDDAKVTHMQKIHVGSRCPNLSDDNNKDGIIDIEESSIVTGASIISLDSDLSSEENGKGVYPLGGGFTFNMQIPIIKLESDLRKLNLVNRVVLIHGVHGLTQLPTSVATQKQMPLNASVPIACGVIQRME